MKHRFIIIVYCMLACAMTSVAQQAVESSVFRPLASEGAVVVAGNARFTVLTPKLIRMEWSEDAVFEDRATLGIVNRDLPVPDFKVRRSSSKIVITTSALTLEYRGNGKFDEDNLSVKFTMTDPCSRTGKKTVSWHPGMDDSGNLLGTSRTLDRCAGDKTIEPYDKGVISRDGWAVIDETDRQVFVPVDSDWKYWVENRTDVDRLDLYMFAYGHNYTEAISDFTKIAGKIPLPPKYTFGYWWCRYWQYSDFELLDLADHFESFNMPIDVMIIDMDWHETWADLYLTTPPVKEGGRSGRDAFNQRIGWTGWTWKKEFFPKPEAFFNELHRRGIKTSLNLHFNNGIQPYEEPYERFVKDYTSRTSDYDGPKDYVYDGSYQYAGNDFTTGVAGDKAPVAFRMSQMEWADAFFNSVIRPFECQGVDFWWLDWQQWRNSRYVDGLNNTFWLNYTFFNDKVRQSESDGIYASRPMIYHRWGGIGSHRYQVGFSGDTFATWKVLGYLPYFTATASNVAYGYWGHDIGGHMQPRGVRETDPELYTRWLQSGVFTPIFKTHSTKDMSMEKRFWVFPDHFDPMRAAVRLRYDLSPYIYTAARQAYDTGISICRPMYYYWPESEEAYTWTQEYMFGDDILATVVCQPADTITGLAERPMWFPEGSDWYDVSTGRIYKGGTKDTLLYTINENPYFVKAGAVIPMAGTDIMNLQEQSDEIRLFVTPGEGEHRTSVYEDDGNTQAYDSEYAVTEIIKYSVADKVTVKVMPRKGHFNGISDSRRITIVLDGVVAPENVTIGGRDVPYSRYASYERKEGKSVWGYDGKLLQTIIYLEEKSAEELVEIVCNFNGEASPEVLAGKKGLIRRMMSMTPEAKFHLAALNILDLQLPVEFLDIATCGSYMTEDPFNAVSYLEKIDVDAMNESYAKWERLSGDFKKKISAQTEFVR